MTGFFNRDQLAPRRNGGEGSGHLVNGAERIAGSVNKQRRSPQPWEVLRAELFRFARRVQRVGEEQQRIRDSRRLRGQKSSLPPPIRMPAEYDEFRRDLTHTYGGPQ